MNHAPSLLYTESSGTVQACEILIIQKFNTINTNSTDVMCMLYFTVYDLVNNNFRNLLHMPPDNFGNHWLHHVIHLILFLFHFLDQHLAVFLGHLFLIFDIMSNEIIDVLSSCNSEVIFQFKKFFFQKILVPLSQ